MAGCLLVIRGTDPVLASTCTNLGWSHPSAMQYSAGNSYNAQYAQFGTYIPHVNDIHHDFSLEHDFLYTQDSHGTYIIVEVGVYVGVGQQIDTPDPYFYVAWVDSDGIYHERDDFAVTYGTTNSYEVVYNSYDPLTHNYYYDLLFNGSRKEQVINDGLNLSGHFMFGGEATHPGFGYNEIKVSASSEQVETTTLAWMNLTPSDWQTKTGDSFTQCVDGTITWTYFSNWDSYYADGNVT